MIHDFIKIVNSDVAIRFLERSLDVLYDKDYPFCSYVAINYSEKNLINVKFYVTSFKKVDISLIKSFFPYSARVEHAYQKYEEGKVYCPQSMGVCFVQKISPSGVALYTYGQRMKEDINPPIDQGGLIYESKIFDDYFAHEICEDSSYDKHYYIIKNRDNIKTLLSRAELDVDEGDMHLIEYSTFQGKQKVLLAMRSVAATEVVLQKTGTPEFLRLHDFIRNKFGLIPASPGKYLHSSVRSIHYLSSGEPAYFRDSLALQSMLALIKQGEASFDA